LEKLPTIPSSEIPKLLCNTQKKKTDYYSKNENEVLNKEDVPYDNPPNDDGGQNYYTFINNANQRNANGPRGPRSNGLLHIYRPSCCSSSCSSYYVLKPKKALILIRHLPRPPVPILHCYNGKDRLYLQFYSLHVSFLHQQWSQ
jgi:hypothetical protein